MQDDLFRRRAKQVKEIYQKRKTFEIQRYLSQEVKRMIEKTLRSKRETISDEVLRRFNQLTKQLIIECIDVVNQIFDLLNTDMTGNTFLSEVMKLIQLKLIVIPEIGTTKCSLVHSYIAKFLSKSINAIKMDYVQKIMDKQRHSSTISSTHKSQTHVHGNVRFESASSTIGKSSYGEFIKAFKSVTDHSPTPFVRIDLISINVNK